MYLDSVLEDWLAEGSQASMAAPAAAPTAPARPPAPVAKSPRCPQCAAELVDLGRSARMQRRKWICISCRKSIMECRADCGALFTATNTSAIVAHERRCAPAPAPPVALARASPPAVAPAHAPAPPEAPARAATPADAAAAAPTATDDASAGAGGAPADGGEWMSDSDLSDDLSESSGDEQWEAIRISDDESSEEDAPGVLGERKRARLLVEVAQVADAGTQTEGAARAASRATPAPKRARPPACATAAEPEVVEDLSREDEGAEHEPASAAAGGGTRSEPTSATAAAAGARSEPERAADGGVALGTELMVSLPGVGLVRGVVIAYHTGSVDLWRVQLHPHTPGRARGSAATPSTTAAKAQARGSAPSVHYLTRADVERGLADAASAGASRRDEVASDDSDQAEDDSLTDNEEDELLLLPRCPKSHKLQAEVVVASCVCDRCACTAAAGARVLSCRLCDWDLCDRCYSGPTERAAT